MYVDTHHSSGSWLTFQAVAIAWVVIIPLWIEEGLGLHINDIKSKKTKAEILMQNSLLLYVAELFYATALFCAKASILSFYWRMFRVTNIKLPIQILGASALIWIIIRVSITPSNESDHCPNSNRRSWVSSTASPFSVSGTLPQEAHVPFRIRSSSLAQFWSTSFSISLFSPCQFYRFGNCSCLLSRRLVSC
jgi:hypothetical protein